MSSSEDEQSYQPVLAEKIRASTSSPRPQSPSTWPKDGVNLYTNELFTDGDVLGGGPQGAPSTASYNQNNGEEYATSPSGNSRPASSNRMAQQKSSFAARRQERMAANPFATGAPPRPNAHSPTTSGMVTRKGSGPDSGNSFYSGGGDSPSRIRTNQADSSFASSRSESAPVFGLASTYDPNAGEEDDDSPMPAASNGGSMPAHRSPLGPQRPPAPIQVDVSDLPTFLTQPGPKHGPIQCYIVRDKGSAKMYPRYTLFLEDGKHFLMAARKRKKATTSNYVISLDHEDLARESEKFFGKLRSNFVGTEFTAYDNGDKSGRNGGAVDRDAEGGGTVRQELGCVTYQYNVLGTRGPRRMTGIIPHLDPASGQSHYRPTSEDDSMLDRLKNNRALNDLVVMHNKPPRWNEELNAYCLNFNGRVTEASVKNFQLITDDNQNHVILQFGKTARNTFTMDYQWPISALQAFAICLSSFDNKLACE